MRAQPNREKQAFPHGDPTNGGDIGMTKRELIAGKILAGFCANPAVFAANSQNGWALVNCTDKDLAGYSRHLADALLAELSRGGAA